MFQGIFDIICLLEVVSQISRFFLTFIQCPAGRVFQHRVGSGRVLDKISGSGSGSGRVGVLKFTIGYFRVSFLLSGISGYFGYFRVFWVFLGMSCIFGYFWIFLYILKLFSNIY